MTVTVAKKIYCKKVYVKRCKEKLKRNQVDKQVRGFARNLRHKPTDQNITKLMICLYKRVENLIITNTIFAWLHRATILL